MSITINTNFLIPLLILFSVVFIFALGFFIAFLNIKNFTCTKDLNTKDNKYNNRIKIITKKDMAYWLAIILLFTIFWVSSYLYEDIDTVSYISFSGTIVSIFLGIVAIIYSFFQTFDNSSTKGELSKLLEALNESSDKIVNSVNKFSELENNIESINSTTKEITKLVNAMNTDIVTKLETVITMTKTESEWETDKLDN
ncbi:MAG: hypothetical protein ACLUL3_10170 [Romboutsia timonensis]|uniref:hypothetical protein n=1 Tax=Romboutsia timonensis TaxID=1776391 RepID=UPI0039944172